VKAPLKQKGEVSDISMISFQPGEVGARDGHFFICINPCSVNRNLRLGGAFSSDGNALIAFANESHGRAT